MNSIAVYVTSWTMSSFFGDALGRHFGRAISLMAGLTLLAHPVLDVPPGDFLRI